MLADIRAAAATAAPITVQLGPPDDVLACQPRRLSAGRRRTGRSHPRPSGCLARRRAGTTGGPRVRSARDHHRGVSAGSHRCRRRSAARLHGRRSHRPAPLAARSRAEGPRRWNPVADMVFERPLVVGTGGLPMEVSVAALADPEVAPLFGAEAVDVPAGAEPHRGRGAARARHPRGRPRMDRGRGADVRRCRRETVRRNVNCSRGRRGQPSVEPDRGALFGCPPLSEHDRGDDQGEQLARRPQDPGGGMLVREGRVDVRRQRSWSSSAAQRRGTRGTAPRRARRGDARRDGSGRGITSTPTSGHRKSSRPAKKCTCTNACSHECCNESSKNGDR